MKIKTIILSFTISIISGFLTSCVVIGHKDASSPEMAIVVNSTKQEKKYLRKLCSDCIFIEKEFILPKDGKSYSVHKFHNKLDGQIHYYYFDVSRLVKRAKK